MSAFSSVADLARRMRIDNESLLQRFCEAGAPKTSVASRVFEADVAALSAHYRTLLGPRAVEIAAEVRKEATSEEPRRNRVILVGQLGSDQISRYMPSGDAVTNIRLATTDRYRRICERVLEQGDFPTSARALLYLDLLLRRVPANLSAFARGMLRAFFCTSIDEASRSHQVSSQTARARSLRVGDVQSCRTAERESAIHPAFAPPRVVI